MKVRPLPWIVIYALERFDGKVVSIEPISDRELERRMHNVIGLEVSGDQLAAYREYMASEYMASRSSLERCRRCGAWTLSFIPHDCPARPKPKPKPNLPLPRLAATLADIRGLHPWPPDKLGGSQYKRNGEDAAG